MSCIAKETPGNGVKERGRASIEWYDNNKKPQYYCYGYIDNRTDELIDECKRCRKHVCHAQEDLENYRKVNKEVF